MTFTYTLTTDIGKVRLELGDTVSGDGVKPKSQNLTDEEIQVLLDREGSVMGAVAAACELLARTWARFASLSAGSLRNDLGTITGQWADRAKELRAQYGGGSLAFAIDAHRDDGYHDMNPHVEDDESEYQDSRTIYIQV